MRQVAARNSTKEDAIGWGAAFEVCSYLATLTHLDYGITCLSTHPQIVGLAVGFTKTNKGFMHYVYQQRGLLIPKPLQSRFLFARNVMFAAFL